MFQVMIMVEDKKLPQVLWALDGLIAEPPQLIPVRGAKVETGKVVATMSGKRISHRMSSLLPPAGTLLKAPDLLKLARKAGGHATKINGLSFSINELINNGAIARVKRGAYQVL